MQGFIQWLLKTSGQASVLIILVLLTQWFMGQRLSPRWRYRLWGLVLVRLLLPVTWESGLSLYNGQRYALASFERMTGNSGSTVGIFGDQGLARNPQTAQNNTTATKPTIEAEGGDTTTAKTVQSGLLSGPADGFRKPSSPHSMPKAFTWRPLLPFLWLGGVIFLGLRILCQNYRFWQHLRQQHRITNAGVLEMLAQCQQAMSLRAPLILLETAAIKTPALYGLFQRKILLPTGMIERFALAELRYVFLHELAHIKRRDMPVNWLMTILQIAHWFNPLIWLAFRRMAADRELACDELVLSSEPKVETQGYGQTIIKLLEGFVRPVAAPGVLGLLEDKNQMERRMRMIAKYKKTNRWSVLAICLLLGLGILTLTDAQNETSATKASGDVTADASHAQVVADMGDVIDSKTGLKFVAVKTIAGTNDVIEYPNRIVQSPNGKFLLWWGHMVPADGSPTFTLKELKGAGIASWSPDGRKIAFNSEGILVLEVSPETGQPAGAARKLLEEKEDWFRGRIYWSADSERILFVKWNRQMQREAGAIALGDNRLNQQPNYADFGLLSPDGKTTAYSVSMEGIWARPTSGEPPWIARGRSGGWLFDDLVLWPPDSQWLVSAVGGWMREEIHLTRLSDRQGFDLFPPEVAGTFVGKSTDSKKLRFYRSSFDLRTNTKVVPVSGGPALNIGLSVGLDELEDCFWSADSASLAVHGTDKEGNQQLWSVPLAGGDSVRFKIESLGTNDTYLWLLSPDSKNVLYAVGSGTNQGSRIKDFYVVPISLKDGRTTGPAKLVYKGWQPPSAGTETRLAWSPDGTKIVMPNKGQQMGDLWILSADGGKPVQLTHSPGEVEQNPQWSPNSAMIAFNLHASDREILQVIPAQGGTARTILTTPQGQLPPYDWSPDNKELVVARDGIISSFPVTGGSARVIIRLSEFGFDKVSWLGWSPDGQHLAFQGKKAGETSRLCLFSPGTQKIEKMDQSPSSAWSFAWSPDSKMISCIAEEAVKTRPAGVIRELDVAEAVLKAQALLATTSPTNSLPSEYSGPKNPPSLVNGVFSDNFDRSNIKNWDFQDPSTEGSQHGHEIKNGELVLENTRANIGSPNWTNYVIKVRLCIKSGKGLQTLAGLGFRRGKGGTYFLCPGPFDRDLWLGIGFRDPSGTFRVGRIDNQPYPFALDKWYTLQAEVQGNKIKASVDDKLVIEAEDDRMAHGYVGLLAGNCRVHYDDFSIQLLP